MIAAAAAEIRNVFIFLLHCECVPCVKPMRGAGAGSTGWELRLWFHFQFLDGELKRVDMNASRTGSSETVYRIQIAPQSEMVPAIKTHLCPVF